MNDLGHGREGSDDHLVESLLARSLLGHDESLVGRITEPDFTALASRHPVLWRNVAAELVRRLSGETTW